MKNGYYIHEKTMLNGHVFSGVQKKINEQIKVLRCLTSIKELTLELRSSDAIAKVLKRIPFGPSAFCWERLIYQIENPEFIYIRKCLFDRGMYNFLKQIKKKYPMVKIVLELPTYPYDQELFAEKKNLLMYPNEVYFRNKLYKFVDRIVTFTDDKEIFGIPAISIQNGVNIEEYPIKKSKLENSEIHLTAVASFQKYHGYERVINGLAEYYNAGGNRRIVLDMVGGGQELATYKDLVRSANLQEHVVFWGPQYGDELNDVFDQADIGLGSFGFYKIGLEIASSLKLREYLARGLPVIGGSRQDLLTEETFPYYLEFPNDETNLDMERIIAFYDRIYCDAESNEQVVRQIRQYAEENVSWKKTFIPVMEYLQYQ